MPSFSTINLGKSLLEAKFPFKNYLIAAVGLNIIVIAAVLLLRPYLPPQVPLFYGTAEGEGQLGSTWQLIIPNLVALAVSVTNLVISRFVKDDFLEKTLVVCAMAASFLAMITVIKIIFLVGSF